jgi:dethiobiotin synthetase
VTGTTTGVGKTWVGSSLLAALRAEGASVAARKPVQSFGRGAGATDADVLAQASGEEPTTVCAEHRWYEAPMAPPMAAEVLGREPFTLGDLMSELSWPRGVDYGLVEAVGGPRSPLASGADTVSLARALQPDHTVLVADAELGAINAVLLSVAALPPPAPVVLLNRYEDGRAMHRLNAEWLRSREGLDVVTSTEALLSRLRR